MSTDKLMFCVENNVFHLFNQYSLHLHLYHLLGGDNRPKHHQMMHLIHKCGTRGHPSLYATFRDESLNGVVARIARGCHRSTFQVSVHVKLKRLQALGGAVAMHMS